MKNKQSNNKDNKLLKANIMKNFFSVFALALFLSLPFIASAQPGGDDDVVDAPIDGGISLLVVAGVGYGARKLYNLRNR